MNAVAQRNAELAPEVPGGGAPIVEALDALGLGCAVFDPAYRLSRWNAAFIELMELPEGLVEAGLSFEGYIRFRAERGDYGPEGEEAVAQRLALVRSARYHVLEHVLPGGRTVESRSTPIASGGFVALYADVTERGRAELERRASEERAESAWGTLADAIEAVDAGIVIWDAGAGLITCNRRFREYYASIDDVLVPGRCREDQVEALVERGQIREALGREESWLAERRAARGETGTPFEFQMTDGRWIRAYDHPTSGGGLVSIHIDITEDKKREAALAESERHAAAMRRQLDDAVDALGEGFALYDADDRLVVCNERLRELLAPAADILVPGTPWEAILERMSEPGSVIDSSIPREEWFQQRREERRTRTGSFQYRTSDGAWIRAIDRPTSDGGVVSIRMDISKLKERERELAESEERAAAAWQTLSEAVEALGEGFAVYDADDRMVLCNASMRRMYPGHGHLFEPGATYGEILDRMLARGAFEAAVGREAEWKAERIANRGALDTPFEYRTADGRWIRAIDRRTAEGGTVAIRIDVTDLRTHERDLAEKTRLLEATMDSMAQGIMVLGPDLRVRALNDRTRELMGLPPEVGRVGAHIADLFRHNAELGEYGDGDVEDIVNEQIVRLATGWEQAFDHVRVDGRRVRISRSIMPDGGWVTTYTDVTAEVEAEARLARLAEVPSRNPNPVVEFDNEGRLGFANKTARTLFHEVEQRGIKHPAFSGIADLLAKWKPGRRRGVTEEIEVGERSFQRRVVPGLHRDGILVYFNEITDLRHAEDRLRESEERHRGLVEQMPDAVIVHDGLNIIYGNPAAVEMLAASSAEDLQSRTLAEIHPAEAWPEIKAYIAEGLARGESSPLMPATMIRLDGQPIDVELIGQPFDHRGERLAQVVVRDVTEQRRAEADAERLADQLSQARKMEAIGTLAGGIAHDFNNLLGAIIGYADLTADDVESDAQAAHNLSQITVAARRAQELVAQILAFSRREQGEVRTVHLDAIVDEVLDLLRPSTPETIEIERRIACTGAAIDGKEGQIHQVLMNLCINAVHAIGSAAGRISVTLEERRLSRPLNTAVGPLEPGEYYVIEVADSGSGMTARTVDRMFEPFFTTKGVGEGTGMGLAVVHGIVGDHGGAIDVDSAPRRGTTIRVYLPRGTGSGPATAETRGPRSRAAPGEGRVLVVDDEPMIADMAAKVLERQGYEVERVYSGLQALAILRVRGGEFDLMVTDQTMPNLGGDRLISEAHRVAPSLPVILSSGYGRALSADDAAELGAAAFLSKPYSPDELCDVVSEVMERTGDGPEHRTESEPEP